MTLGGEDGVIHKGTAVTLLTAAHRLQGEINPSGQRLHDLLNYGLTDFVQMENAQIYLLTYLPLLREMIRSQLVSS